MNEEKMVGNETMANVNELFDELARVIKENFVAIYQKEANQCKRKVKKSSGWLQSLDFYVSAQYVGIRVCRFS